MRALLVLGLLGACSSAPTELLLVVQGNLTAPALGAVRVQVTDSVDAGFVDGFSPAPTCVCVDPTACTGSVASATMPLTVPLDPGHQGTTPFEIEVSGFGSPDCSDPGSDFIDATAVVHFVERERLGVYVSLDSECVGVECEDGYTCKAGACMPNDTPPVTVTDMGVTPPHTTTDLAVPSGDMATPPAFTLLSAAPSLWNVALGSGMAALGYAENDAANSTSSFSYGILRDTGVTGFSSVPLTAPVVSMCAVYDEHGAQFAFGVATASTVTMFQAGGPGGGAEPGLPVYTAPSGTISQLQCARSPDGVVFAWLQSPSPVGTGTNGSPAHAPSSTPPMITLVDIVTSTAMSPTGSSPVAIASATAFHLASTGFYTSANAVPIAVMFVGDATSYKSCSDSVLYAYNTTNFNAPPDVTTCVPLDPAKGLDAVSIAGTHSAVVGVKPSSSKTSFGAASGPGQSVASALPAQLAMAPVASESFAVAFTATGTTDLILDTGSVTLVHPISSVPVTTGVDVMYPVELASDDAGRTFVTWVEGGALHGLITP